MEILHTKLNGLVKANLFDNDIWELEFFRMLENPSRPHIKWEMLVTWAENMMRASYGFQTYVLTLAARAQDEKVRRLLLENAWEELGDHEYPKRSHFQMICNLSRLCGIPEENIKCPSMLPTSKNHIQTHIERCKNAPFLQALGMIFLIENLTRLEFEKLLRGFIKFWEIGTGRPLEDFVLNGGTEYFTSNMEADDGHAEDVEVMIIECLQSAGVDINDEKQLQPYLDEISRGMAESAELRKGFLKGVYDFVLSQHRIAA